MSTEVITKKKLKAPPLIVLVLLFIVVASILTYIVPAGAYDIDPNTQQSISGTYHTIDKTPVSPFSALGMIYDGMNMMSSTINLVLFLGGIISIFLSLGAVEEVLNWTVFKLKDKGSILVTIICCFMMSTIGAFAANNALITFVALGPIICKKLRLDPLVGVGIFFYCTFVGFCTGPMTAYIAQGIAGVPLYSGFAVRTIWWLFCTLVCTVYILWYSKRISKNPSKSFMGNVDWINASVENAKEENVRLNASAVAVIILLFGGFFFQAYAITSLGWSKGSAFSLLGILAIISALIRKKTADDIVKDFANGLKDMAFICFIMGAAATVGLVLQQGNVLPTIVNAVTVPLSTVTKGVSSIIMFILNCIINVIIPSRGGQAAIVIPLMAPIGDMLDISRQIIVSAFSLGDGLTNMINPLDGATFAAIALGGVGSYGKWFKWAAPLTLILMVLSCIMLYGLTIIGWTGM